MQYYISFPLEFFTFKRYFILVLFRTKHFINFLVFLHKCSLFREILKLITANIVFSVTNFLSSFLNNILIERNWAYPSFQKTEKKT